ncbi:MAG TPA: alpha/beta hydrolase [Solirubrobacteraceae bacterium]|nr:alpha/beta hydrolase [Solirubrobacteraceae bacterium]
MGRRAIATNGIELSVQEEGEGPLVVLCHGFPELSYSWRHQLPALSAAGYRVLVPDMRGYGESSAPVEIGAYDLAQLCGDMCGLLDAVGEQAAIFVGHDWGANLAWQLAVLHPERVRAVAGLSVPFVPRAPAAPIPIMRRHLGEDFYIVWFQQPGVADEALARDVRRTLTTSRQWTSDWAEEEGHEPRRPAWLSEQELEVYVEAFERTGFTGGLNWYRNIDRNWELTEPAAERRVEQPAMFLTGELDLVRRFMPAEAMRGWVTDLRSEVVVVGAGHWVQQQAPQDVNAALLEFLAEVA